MNAHEVDRRSKRLERLSRFCREVGLDKLANEIDSLDEKGVIDFINVIRKWLI